MNRMAWWMLAVLILATPQPCAAASSLRFFGNGTGDIDRVKIRIDDPANSLPGPPADVGATDFTIEFWMRALPGDNPAPGLTCGVGLAWIYGNIVLDRDRYNQDRKFGLSLGDGRLVYGVSGDGTGDFTICGTTDVRDGEWHHVAIDRRRADGRMRLYVDGALEAGEDGPDGDISYPDDGVPGNFCGGPCVNSDPFIVLGAEKHDAGPQYPAFQGWVDELRISASLRYDGTFSPPVAAFMPDGSTLALYHFDEGAGDSLYDGAGAVGGPSHGVVQFGGSPFGPLWSMDRFAGATAVGDPPRRPAPAIEVSPNPASGAVKFSRLAELDRALEVRDAAGRIITTLRREGAGDPRWNLRDRSGRRVKPGIYFVRAIPAGGPAIRLVVR